MKTKQEVLKEVLADSVIEETLSLPSLQGVLDDK